MAGGTANRSSARVVQLPARTPRLDDETTAEIVRMDIRGTSQSEIARRVGVTRGTVSRVLKRTQAARLVALGTDAERMRAVALYRELQRVAWEAAENAMERARSPAMVLAEIRQAQARIDALLGLELSAPDAFTSFVEFRTLVIQAIQVEAPELAPRLAQRLLSPTREPA